MISTIFRRAVVKANATDPRVEAAFMPVTGASCLNPARISGMPTWPGSLVGVSDTTGRIVTIGLHELYNLGVISACNAVILGGYACGKSSLAKTVYGLRALARGVRIVVFDRKRQRESGTMDAQGEYLRLAAHVDGTVIRFDRRRGYGAIINVLDPAINPEGSEDTTVGQDELLRMVVTTALDRKLTAPESFALGLAHRTALAAAERQNRVATILDVIDALIDPATSMASSRLTTHDFVSLTDLKLWGRDVALGLDEYVSGDLSGLIDGPSTGPDGQPLDFSNPLLVFDTSALGEGSRALGLIMAVASAYVQARWSVMPGQKLLINEEAYTTGRLEGVPAILRAIAKRGRSTGTAVLTLLHHLSDVPEGSDLWSLVRETDVVHLFRQDKTDDADQAMTFFGLPPALRETIMTLQKGQHLLKVADYPLEIVTHLRTADELALTNTDDGMMAVTD